MTDPDRQQGAIAVIVKAGQLLVIERSALVRAPGTLCFPGGGIEQGETEQAALVRELQEEINVAVRPLRRIWQSTTDSGIELKWWQAELFPDEQPQPNPAEVAHVFWMSPEEMAKHSRLLLTNRRFLEAMWTGEFSLE